MLQRKWNYQPTYNLNYTAEPSSCNYYPITSAISAGNFTVVVDRSHAATVRPTTSGRRFEIMVHRRLLYDDHKGVD